MAKGIPHTTNPAFTRRKVISGLGSSLIFSMTPPCAHRQPTSDALPRILKIDIGPASMGFVELVQRAKDGLGISHAEAHAFAIRMMCQEAQDRFRPDVGIRGMDVPPETTIQPLRPLKLTARELEGLPLDVATQLSTGAKETYLQARRPLAYTAEDAHDASDEWGCNCGPGAVAGILGLTLREVRAHVGDFEAKRYTNPTLMWSILGSLDVKFSYRGGHLGQQGWPRFGLARIQWEGPWTKPGVPARAAYRHTHWVGARRTADRTEIFDMNAIAAGGWLSLDEWSGELVPWLLSETVPRASGAWHLTDAVEITL